ncbi:hypothetical protein NIES4072_43480 [Nostoc commune NIES-4072]|uniref:Uncharacterized protein n=1 Tax=Nostoc commune NIES-4072 TaxID=2005467 RepID=A0A2R5FPH5_NOSCO|nr:hypothetical protein [Nostoc commune]BBD68340.1 hypothetical protein NIES4070_47350 [Nostoc commune HK-02]GBG20666.1 hypothetical protein NIES4072_43480 [Nostoc commune NIES-4072]
MKRQISDRPLAVTNSTLSILIGELITECLKVQALVNQLQLPSLTVNQQAEILAELLACWFIYIIIVTKIFRR